MTNKGNLTAKKQSLSASHRKLTLQTVINLRKGSNTADEYEPLISHWVKRLNMQAVTHPAS